MSICNLSDQMTPIRWLVQIGYSYRVESTQLYTIEYHPFYLSGMWVALGAFDDYC